MKRRLFALACATMLGVSAFGLACKDDKPSGDISVYMPDGAPALAFAGLMHEDTQEDGVSYYVTNASQIASKVTGKNMEENADICVLPLTVATAKVGNGENYQMVGAVTHGNLYMISKNTDLQYEASNLGSLIGQTVGVLQLGSTPGLIFKSALANNHIPFADLSVENTVPREDKVNLKPIIIPEGTPPAQVLNGMIGQGVNLFVMAEPAVTALAKGGFATVGNVQTIYGENGYTQAVLVAKKSIVNEKSDWLKSFLSDVTESAVWSATADGETLVAAVQSHFEDEKATSSLNAATLGVGVVTRSGVRFEATSVCKAKTEAFLQVAKSIDNKTVLPSENFYWSY